MMDARKGLLLLLVAVGCRTVNDPRLENHLIPLDAKGRAIDPASGERLLGEKQEFKKLTDAVFAAAARRCDRHCGEVAPNRARPLRKLLIHVHGGLNTARGSRATALHGLGMMEDPNSPDWHYPIFLTWPSGALTTLGEHFWNFRQGRNWTVLGPITSPIVVASDIAGGVALAPKNAAYTLLTDAAVGLGVAFDVDSFPSVKNVAKLHPVAAANGYQLSPMPTYRRGFWRQAVRGVAYLLTAPVKFSVGIVALEGFGQGAWDVMLHRAHNAFRIPEEFDVRRLDASQKNALKQALERKPSGAVARFFQHLADHVADNPGVDFEITLVGHSMGAIVLNQALLLYPELPIRRVIYMAPACGTAEAAAAIVPFLKFDRSRRFHLLTLHPTAEQDEVNLFDLPPRGSLLEWIDNWYTTPKGHADRTFGKWLNVMQALHLFHDVREQMTIKAFSVDGRSMPQKHGHFNQCPFWTAAFRDPEDRKLY